MKITLEGSEIAINKFLKSQRAYMKRKSIVRINESKKENTEDNEELIEVSELYFEKFDKRVPKNKAKDIDWIKEKLNG